MGLTPIPLRPPALSELDRYRHSITPKRSTEHLWFHLIPVFAVLALVVLSIYEIISHVG